MLGFWTRYRSALALVALLATSCVPSDTSTVIRDRDEGISARLSAASQPAPAVQAGDPLTVSDAVWLGNSVLKLPSGEPLPDKWLEKNAIALRTDMPSSLAQIISVLSADTRIPIRLAGGAESAGTAAAATGTPDGMIVAYEGPLPALLDLICGYFNVNWVYQGGAIVISRYQTRTFVVDALPGSFSVEPPGSTGASGGASSSATATPLASATIDIWQDISSTLDSLIGSDGSVTISQSSGTIVISTTPEKMERVSAYIAEENQRLSAQVAITLELFTVTMDDSQSYGLDLTAALKSIEGLPTINLTGPGGAVAGGGSLTVNLVEPSELTGSKGIAQALSKIGHATRVAQIPMTTLNNRPAYQRVAKDQAYVSETSTTTTNTSTTAEISTDTVSTGISVSMLPRIMSDGRILLQYALAQGELLNLPKFTSGTTTVQLPETQGLSFSQQVMMKSGSTLILAGYDQSQANSNKAGMLNPSMWPLGGTQDSTKSRQMVVIAITPRQIQVARPEAS